MPYNTRRKSLSLVSLGIHIPVTHAARAASKSAATRSSTPSSAAASSPPDARPSKRFKTSHHDLAVETPPPSPPPVATSEATCAYSVPQIDLEGIHDDIVEASIRQLQSTANRPHLIKELAVVLSQKLSSVQQSANPCAIISSRLTSFMKRPCWTALMPCPLAKELEAVHPRRTYFFLTSYPRQSLPDSAVAQAVHSAMVTPSVSLTDDSGSDEVEARRRELSPSPEVDLSSPEFDDVDDLAFPMTAIGSYKPRYLKPSRELRRDSPPLEKDEREFTQTADVLQKRKLNDWLRVPDTTDRNATMEYGYRDDTWFMESRNTSSAPLFTSPAMKPSATTPSRKDDEADPWLKLHKMFELDEGAESIEIDELDFLLDGC